MRSILAFILVLILLAVGCGSADEDSPTLAPTAEPTETEIAAEIEAAIEEPATATPTAVPTLEPTETPLPTATPPPLPTNTSPPETPVLPTNTAVPQPTSTSEPAPPTQTPVPAPTSTQAPPPPAAGGQIVITGVNKSVEYVDLSNVGGQAVDISGWLLVSEKGNQDCGLGGVIEPGATLRVWALASDSAQGGYNCGFGNNIWNNSDSDPAVLYDSSGTLVDRYP